MQNEGMPTVKRELLGNTVNMIGTSVVRAYVTVTWLNLCVSFS